MNIATLISGDYRCFSQLAPTYRKLFGHTDIYFSTWSHSRVTHPVLTDREFVLTGITPTLIRSHLPGCSVKIEEFSTLYWKSFRYNCPMISKWDEGLKMIKKSKKKYDGVIFVRPDLFFDPHAKEAIKEITFTPGIMRNCWFHDNGRLNDILFAVSMEDVDKVIPTISEWNTSPNGDWHTFFHDFIKAKGLQIEEMQVGFILGRPPYESMKTFNDAMKNSNEWRDGTVRHQLVTCRESLVRELWGNELVDRVIGHTPEATDKTQ